MATVGVKGLTTPQLVICFRWQVRPGRNQAVVARL